MTRARHRLLSEDDGTDPSARPAAVAFAVITVLSVIVILITNRHQWFYVDDWEFLYGRSLDDPQSILRPHWDHAVVLPAVAYRVLYRIFGLNVYWPYQALVIAAHVTVVVCLRAVMRRAAVRPWVATGCASVMLLLGAGRPNLAWSFQITLTGALALGLVYLLLATGNRSRSRDVLAVLAAACAVLTSGVGVLLVLATLPVLLVVRGWKSAVALTAPPIAVYLAWLAIAPASKASPESADAVTTVRFAAELFYFTVTRVAGSIWLGVVLAGLVVGGSALAVRAVWKRGPAQGATLVLSLTGAAFVVAVAIGRSRGLKSLYMPAPSADQPRYIYLLAALLLPSVGLALSHLVTRHRSVGPLACVLLAALLVVNVPKLEPPAIEIGSRSTVLAYAEAGDRLNSRSEASPLGIFGVEVSVAELAAAHRIGRVPDPPSGAPERDTALLTLTLTPSTRTDATSCRTVRKGERVSLRPGHEVHIESPAVMQVWHPEGLRQGVKLVFPIYDVISGPLTVVADKEWRICH